MVVGSDKLAPPKRPTSNGDFERRLALLRVFLDGPRLHRGVKMALHRVYATKCIRLGPRSLLRAFNDTSTLGERELICQPFGHAASSYLPYRAYSAARH